MPTKESDTNGSASAHRCKPNGLYPTHAMAKKYRKENNSRQCPYRDYCLLTKITEMNKINYTGFNDDAEKMADFREMDRESFLQSYSYLTDMEYDLTIIGEVAKLQNEHFLPCPRCGKASAMRLKLAENALSRHADVYVCSPCGIAEAIADYKKEEIDFSKWAAVEAPERFLFGYYG